MTFSSLRAAKGEAFAAEGHSKLAETGVTETGPEFEQNNPAPLVELEVCYHLEFCYPHQLSLMEVCYFHLLPLQVELCYFHLLPLQMELCYPPPQRVPLHPSLHGQYKENVKEKRRCHHCLVLES